MCIARPNQPTKGTTMLEILPGLIVVAIMISLIVVCTKGLADGLKRFVDNHQADLLDTPMQLIELFGLELAHVIGEGHLYWSPGFVANEASTGDLQVNIEDGGGFSVTFMNQGDDRVHLFFSYEAWAGMQLATHRAVLRDIAKTYQRYRQQIDESLREAFLS